jgi:hypothetical protein
MLLGKAKCNHKLYQTSWDGANNGGLVVELDVYI